MQECVKCCLLIFLCVSALSRHNKQVLENPLARDNSLREALLATPDFFLKLVTYSSLALEIFFLPMAIGGAVPRALVFAMCCVLCAVCCMLYAVGSLSKACDLCSACGESLDFLFFPSPFISSLFLRISHHFPSPLPPPPLLPLLFFPILFNY